MNLLASISYDNINYALKVASSEISFFEAKPVSGRNIMREIKESLKKDYFAPFEREDIFILSQKLCELCDNSIFLLNASNESKIFADKNTLSLCESLRIISGLTANIFSTLQKYPKQGDLKPFFNKIDTEYNRIRNSVSKLSDKETAGFNSSFLHYIEICAQNCNDLATLTQYILIKNS